MQPIKSPIGRLFLHIIMWLAVLISTVPFIWTTLQSLKTRKQAHSRTPLFWFEPTLDNYVELWLDKVPDHFGLLLVAFGVSLLFLVLLGIFAKSRKNTKWIIALSIAVILWAIPQFIDMAEFYDYFVNTIIVAVGTVIFSISIASLAAYGLARYAGLAGVLLILMALAFRSLPRLAFALPYYWMGQMSGLHDTHFLVIVTLAAVNQPFAIYMLRSFFMDIPREIEESAMIDGASRLRAYISVIIPIMWPGIVATSLFTLVLVYHEFLLVSILTQSNWTLAVAMRQFLPGISVSGSLPLQSAAAVSAALPLVIVVLIFQKQLVKGLTAGSVKG